MARIRSIKPDFFRDETLSDLEEQFPKLHPMLVFAGLWCVSDKQGVFEWSPRVLKLDILPLLAFDIVKSLSVLEKSGLIRRFEHEGRMYGHVMNFGKHQRINGREASEEPKYPTPINYMSIGEGSTLEATRKHSGSNAEASGTTGREGKGMEGKGGAADAAIVTTDPLFHQVEEAFLSKNDGRFDDYAKERVCIHSLLKKAKGRSPDNPGLMLSAMLAAFWKLKTNDTSSKGFWRGQPFLPSALSPLWSRVLETMRNDTVSPDVMAVINGGAA